MVLTSQRILCSSILINTPRTLHQQPLQRSFLVPSSWPNKPTSSSSSFVVSASKKFSSSRTGRFDSKNKRSSVPTKDDEEDDTTQPMAEIDPSFFDGGGTATVASMDDVLDMPQLPGDKPDFWEGSQWDAFGFFVQYMWAFGIGFALIACGIAVATYNEGATDFKDTPVYKESIQSRELLEEPEGSNSEIFESNPTEQAPSVE